jgi:transposase
MSYTSTLPQLEREMRQVVEHSRDGKILTSIPPIGPIQAAAILASIGHIANFANAAKLKSYFGWAPAGEQTGVSYDRERLTPRGNRSMKRMMYLIVWQAIQMKDSEWARLYELCWLHESSAEKREGLISSVTSYFDDTQTREAKS